MTVLWPTDTCSLALLATSPGWNLQHLRHQISEQTKLFMERRSASMLSLTQQPAPQHWCQSLKADTAMPYG